jgi:CarboxypepD_reg-like domain
MKLRFLIVLFLFTTGLSVQAQIISGKVLEAETNYPVIYANVFLDGSNIGTITDSTGYFTLNTREHSSLPLIVSAVGYEAVRFEKNYLSDDWIIYLKKKDYELEEIQVLSDNIPEAKKTKYLRIFKREFLGTTKNGSNCEILNEEVLYPFYNEKTKILHVNASEPIQIINHQLGYKIVFLLLTFKQSREGLNYKGYSLFFDLKPEDENETEKINRRRLLTYSGSRMNFIRNLYTGSLLYSDFKLYDVTGDYMEADEILYTTQENRKEICVENTVKVYYDQDSKFSYFVLNDECVEIEKNGYYNPESITWFGYMANYRVGDLMPYNYYPETEKQKDWIAH